MDAVFLLGEVPVLLLLLLLLPVVRLPAATDAEDFDVLTGELRRAVGELLDAAAEELATDRLLVLPLEQDAADAAEEETDADVDVEVEAPSP